MLNAMQALISPVLNFLGGARTAPGATRYGDLITLRRDGVRAKFGRGTGELDEAPLARRAAAGDAA